MTNTNEIHHGAYRCHECEARVAAEHAAAEKAVMVTSLSDAAVAALADAIADVRSQIEPPR